MSANVAVENCKLQACMEFSIKSQNTFPTPTTNFSISDCQISGLKSADDVKSHADIVIGNASMIKIENNYFSGFQENDRRHILFLEYSKSGVTDVEIAGNSFASEFGIEADIAYFHPLTRNVTARGNSFRSAKAAAEFEYRVASLAG